MFAFVINFNLPCNVSEEYAIIHKCNPFKDSPTKLWEYIENQIDIQGLDTFGKHERAYMLLANFLVLTIDNALYRCVIRHDVGDIKKRKIDKLLHLWFDILEQGEFEPIKIAKLREIPPKIESMKRTTYKIIEGLK